MRESPHDGDGKEADMSSSADRAGAGHHSPARALRALVTAAALLGGAGSALAAPPASAATPSPPAVSTGGAHNVSFASATITGSLNPNGSETSYYFQYGVTRAYGAQTAIAVAGSGTHSLSVSAGVGGLQPLTLYHYRLVAVNAGGVSLGTDHTFLTKKVPLSLAILASPNPVLWGGTVVVQGTLSGTGNAGRVVVLQANPWPFNGGFHDLANPQLTGPTGGFSFPVLGMQLNTQFRVVTSANPLVISPVAFENVAVRVASHVRRTQRAHFARIFGTVTPAADGAEVGILRIVHGRGVLAGGTVLRHRNGASSSFSRVVRVTRGLYRVLVVVKSGALASSYGQTLFIG
jgi:hypothetical protein